MIRAADKNLKHIATLARSVERITHAVEKGRFLFIVLQMIIFALIMAL